MWSRIGVSLLAIGALLVGCGTETPIEYGVENRESFLAACVAESVDGIFQQRVCQCVYDEAEAVMPFDRFAEIEDQLREDGTAPLPDDLLDLIARCVIEEGDL